MNPSITMPEQLARQLIDERVRDLQRPRPVRRHLRTAQLLRRLAQHFDPQPVPTVPRTHATGPREPRPWSAVRRPRAARH